MQLKQRIRTRRLLIPAVSVLILINALPMALLVHMSVTDWGQSLAMDAAKPFVGLENFAHLLSQARFWRSGLVTLIWILGSLLLQLPLGLAIALVLARASRRNLVMATPFKYVIVLPLVTAPIVVGVMWRFMMFNATGGALNAFLRALGGQGIDWLGRDWALFSVILTDVWEHTPLFVMMLFAGLQSLPNELFEAARCDGASGLQTITRITIPLLTPVIYVVVVIRFIDLMRWIVTIYIMTGGGPGASTEIWNVYLYRLMFSRFEVSTGAAMALFLIVISLLMSIVFVRVTTRTNE